MGGCANQRPEIPANGSKIVRKNTEVLLTSNMLIVGDSEFVMCGSDEGNIRLWKTVAWAKHGNLNFRQKAALQYSEALKKKFKYHPEVKRIARHRHLPKNIYKERIKEWIYILLIFINIPNIKWNKSFV